MISGKEPGDESLPLVDGTRPPPVPRQGERRDVAEVRLRTFVSEGSHSPKAPVRVLEGVSGQAYLSGKAIAKMLHGTFTEDRAAILFNLPALYAAAIVVRTNLPEGRERDAMMHRIERLGARLRLDGGAIIPVKLTVREYRFDDVSQPVRRALYDAQPLPKHGWGRTPLDKS